MGQAEVENYAAVLRSYEEVGGFDVAMDYAFRVGLGEAVREQFAAFQVGHRDVDAAVGVAYFIYGADVGVVERGRCFGLTDETLAVVLVRQQGRREEFQSNGAVEVRIFGLVDHAHTTFAELAGDLVVVEGLINHQGVVYPFVVGIRLDPPRGGSRVDG